MYIHTYLYTYICIHKIDLFSTVRLLNSTVCHLDRKSLRKVCQLHWQERPPGRVWMDRQHLEDQKKVPHPAQSTFEWNSHCRVWTGTRHHCLALGRKQEWNPALHMDLYVICQDLHGGKSRQWQPFQHNMTPVLLLHSPWARSRCATPVHTCLGSIAFLTNCSHWLLFLANIIKQNLRTSPLCASYMSTLNIWTQDVCAPWAVKTQLKCLQCCEMACIYTSC